MYRLLEQAISLRQLGLKLDILFDRGLFILSVCKCRYCGTMLIYEFDNGPEEIEAICEDCIVLHYHKEGR